MEEPPDGRVPSSGSGPHAFRNRICRAVGEVEMMICVANMA